MKILNIPVNNLSFGNVSFGILNELYNREYNDFLIQDIGQPNLSAFDKIRSDSKFLDWFNPKRDKFLSKYNKEFNTLKLWHIANSETSVSKKQFLFTFHELDQLTENEVNILNNQEHVFVSTSYSKDVFESHGVQVPVTVVPLGFDNLHFSVNEERKKVPSNICVWYICGKFENRKRHEKTIKAWIKKYGNQPNHILNLSIYNSFFSPEQNQAVLSHLFEGKPKPFNVNIHGYYDTLAEVNNILNVSDIAIDMSGAEAWSIPSFNAVALGKHAIIHNNTGMKEWANDENSVLIEPSDKISAVDNVFFKPNSDFNVGNIFDYDVEEFSDKLDVVYNKWKSNPINTNGLKLQDQFTWKKSVDKILEVI